MSRNFAIFAPPFPSRLPAKVIFLHPSSPSLRPLRCLRAFQGTRKNPRKNEMGVSYADKQKFSFEGHRNKKKSYYPNMIRFNGSWSSNLTSEKRGKKKKKKKKKRKKNIITNSSSPPPNGSLLSKIHRKSHQFRISHSLPIPFPL